MNVYPAKTAERDAWILSRRPAREIRDPYVPYQYFVEEECAVGGAVEPVATIFLTNRECPFRCLMCDLWRNTLTATVPTGAIPAQIDYALSRLGPARQVKLYNSGSFFDPRAIPPADYASIAARVQGFARVIVENHPAFTSDRCVAFRDLLPGAFEVAMGLETVHPDVLARSRPVPGDEVTDLRPVLLQFLAVVKPQRSRLRRSQLWPAVKCRRVTPGDDLPGTPAG